MISGDIHGILGAYIWLIDFSQGAQTACSSLPETSPVTGKEGQRKQAGPIISLAMGVWLKKVPQELMCHGRPYHDERLRQSYGCKQTRGTRKGRPHRGGFESSLVGLEVSAS